MMSDKREAIKSKRSLTSSKGVPQGIKEEQGVTGRKEDKVRAKQKGYYKISGSCSLQFSCVLKSS